jgi:hypothetical protein
MQSHALCQFKMMKLQEELDAMRRISSTPVSSFEGGQEPVQQDKSLFPKLFSKLHTYETCITGPGTEADTSLEEILALTEEMLKKHQIAQLASAVQILFSTYTRTCPYPSRKLVPCSTLRYCRHDSGKNEIVCVSSHHCYFGEAGRLCYLTRAVTIDKMEDI